ncbi:MAG: Nif3-like dinuclear metal center hexameric protein [Clostridia bacterium]|nr:Nif3-like dinuclear metal center hexameric protein [Clostridia bacterium]
MKTVDEILTVLDEMAPLSTAEEWDNAGFQVGDLEANVKKALVCLDVTEAALEEAQKIGAELIISHHPLLFTPLSDLPADHLIYKLAVAGISNIAMHTNLDKAQGGVNDCLAAALGLTDLREAYGLGRVGTLETALSPKEFAVKVKTLLGTAVRLKEGSRAVKTVGLLGGAGGDVLEGDEVAAADAFVTGEIKHHQWLAAPDVTVVDAGHYATENVVVEPLCAALSAKLPDVEFLPFLATAPYETI